MEFNEFSEKIKNKFQYLNIEINNNQINNYFNYMNLLIEWNEKINLTAITDSEEIILKHFVDSITINKYINKNSNLIDIGTGAGFPGIPIKIIRDDIKITLLDSLNKRIIFLNEIINNLNLKDIVAIHGRAEDFGINNKFREKYDFATSRAVAPLNYLLEYMMPFIKVGGTCICMKGSNIEDELNISKNAIIKLGGKVEYKEKIILPESDIERNIIIIKKVKNTPKEFPRKSGMPKKQPIK